MSAVCKLVVAVRLDTEATARHTLIGHLSLVTLSAHRQAFPSSARGKASATLPAAPIINATLPHDIRMHFSASQTIYQRSGESETTS